MQNRFSKIFNQRINNFWSIIFSKQSYFFNFEIDNVAIFIGYKHVFKIILKRFFIGKTCQFITTLFLKNDIFANGKFIRRIHITFGKFQSMHIKLR